MSGSPKTGINGRDLFLVTASSMLIGGYAIMLLTLTLMYGNDMGFGSVAAGFLSSVFAFASLGCRPFSGLVCDRFPSKRLFILAAAGFAVTPAAFLLHAPYGLLTVVRILQGVCMGIATTAAGAIATAIIPRARFTEGIGYYGIGMAASSAVAPGIGLWLLEHFGYPGVFVFSALAGAGAILLILPVKCPNGTKADRTEESILSGLYEKTALFSALSTLVLAVAQVTIMQFLSYYVTDRGAAGPGSFYAVSTVAVIAIRLLGGRLRKLASDKGLLLAGSVILLGAYGGLFTIYPSAAALCILAVAYGVGHSLTGMVLNSMAVANAPDERIGAANATYLAASDLGYAVGPILWNAWCGGMGYRYIYLISALAVAALLLLFIVKVPKNERNG